MKLLLVYNSQAVIKFTMHGYKGFYTGVILFWLVKMKKANLYEKEDEKLRAHKPKRKIIVAMPPDLNHSRHGYKNHSWPGPQK